MMVMCVLVVSTCFRAPGDFPDAFRAFALISLGFAVNMRRDLSFGMISSRNKSPEMIFSRTLRSLMQRDGVKQKELAAAMGVVQGAVSAWVNGKTPDFPNQQKIAKFFRVTVAELFTGVPKNALETDPIHFEQTESAEVMELREQFNQLIATSPEAVAALKPILNYLRQGKELK
jgi:transcriptional regulator with XRE-family HTH domain